jgi:hypothetical protein
MEPHPLHFFGMAIGSGEVNRSGSRIILVLLVELVVVKKEEED